MRTSALQEIIIGLLLVVFVVLLLNPFSLLMPSMVAKVLGGLAGAALVGFVNLLWREYPKDEREEYQALQVGKVAYSAGVSVLLLGVVVQSVHHAVDPWLVLGLSTMVIAKVAAHRYLVWRSGL